MRPLATLARSSRVSSIFRKPVKDGGLVSVIQAHSATIEGMPQSARLGDFVSIGQGQDRVMTEIARLSRDSALVVPLKSLGAVSPGAPAFLWRSSARQQVSLEFGRVLNAFGQPVDGKGPAADFEIIGDELTATGALHRGAVEQPLKTGVRVIDAFTPLCFGQRLGIFAGSGVGKSSLLAMLAKGDSFDCVVIALVGERSREVREFVAETLGPEGMKKAILVVAAGDESAVMRKRAPLTAMKIAKAQSARGVKTLLLVDSLTRYAHALREVAVLLGEPPVSRGYPSSVFTELPRLLEMAGPQGANAGSITAIATVLVDGDDHNDPVADALRGILDGHLVLDRKIANRGQYPAIDPLTSISRLAVKAWKPSERELITKLKAMISLFEESRDLRMLGGWQPGSDPELDNAVSVVPRLYRFFAQTDSDTAADDVFTNLANFLKTDGQ